MLKFKFLTSDIQDVLKFVKAYNNIVCNNPWLIADFGVILKKLTATLNISTDEALDYYNQIIAVYGKFPTGEAEVKKFANAYLDYINMQKEQTEKQLTKQKQLQQFAVYNINGKSYNTKYITNRYKSEQEQLNSINKISNIFTFIGSLVFCILYTLMVVPFITWGKNSWLLAILLASGFIGIGLLGGRCFKYFYLKNKKIKITQSTTFINQASEKLDIITQLNNSVTELTNNLIVLQNKYNKAYALIQDFNNWAQNIVVETANGLEQIKKAEIMFKSFQKFVPYKLNKILSKDVSLAKNKIANYKSMYKLLDDEDKKNQIVTKVNQMCLEQIIEECSCMVTYLQGKDNVNYNKIADLLTNIRQRDASINYSDLYLTIVYALESAFISEEFATNVQVAYLRDVVDDKLFINNVLNNLDAKFNKLDNIFALDLFNILKSVSNKLNLIN